MKRVVVAVFLVCFLVAGGGSLCAAFEHVRIGCVVPEGTGDADNMRIYYARYFDELSKYTGWNYRLIELHADKAPFALEHGAIDLLLPVEYDSLRAGKNLAYSRFTSYYDTFALFTREDDFRFAPDDVNGIEGASVGLLRDRAANSMLDDFLNAYGITVVKKYYDDEEQMSRALADGETDIVANSATHALKGQRFFTGFGVISSHVAAAVRNARLIEELDAAAEKLHRENPGYDTVILSEAYRKTQHLAINFTAEEAEYIKKCPPLRVVIFENRPPYAIIDEATGAANGIYPDILRAVAEASGLRFEFRAVRSYSEAVQLLRKGGADLIVDVYTNDEAMADFGYTNSIYTEEYSFIGRHNENAKQPDAKILLAEGAPSAVRYARKELNERNIEGRASIRASLDDVKKGLADIAALDSLSLQTKRPLMLYPSLGVVPAYSLKMPMCLAISPQQPPVLKTVLNKAILKLAPQRIDQIVTADIMSMTEKLSFSYLVYYYPLQFGLTVGIILLLFMGATFFYQYGRQMRLQRTALEEKNETLLAALQALEDANAARDDYKYKAETDALTGVLNKAAIETFVRDELAKLTEGRKDAIFIIDLDHFKEANDKRGHQYGDKIIVNFSRALQQIMRRGDGVGRFGGDEFILYCPDIATDSLPYIAESIMEAAHALDYEQRPQLSASIGIAVAPLHGFSYETLFRAADRALYFVKENGRDNFKIAVKE